MWALVETLELFSMHCAQSGIVYPHGFSAYGILPNAGCDKNIFH